MTRLPLRLLGSATGLVLDVLLGKADPIGRVPDTSPASYPPGHPRSR